MRVFLPILTFFLLFTSTANAQDHKSNYLGINFSSGLYPHIVKMYFLTDPPSFCCFVPIFPGGYLVTPAATLTLQNNSFSLGPRIFLPEKNYNRIGGQFSYDYTFKKTAKKNDLTLGMELIYDFHKSNRSFLTNVNNEVYTNNSTRILNELKIIPTIGIRKNFNSNYYLNLTTGFGINFRGSKTTNYIEALPEYKDRNYETPLFSRPALAIMFKIGFGYNWKS